MTNIFRPFPLIFLVIFSGCCLPFASAQNTKIVNWNVQTFFDSKNDGCEYSDFKNSSWTVEKYKDRLTRLCNSIERIDADIFIFEELENEAVLFDISNQLAGNIWNQSKYWPFAAFRKNPGDSIGCGILSRLPLSSVKIHNLDIRSEKDSQPALRPIIELSLICKNGSELILLVNHWKSKASGEEESEVWRNWQESVLTDLFYKNQGKKILAAGDFNRNLNEFEIISNKEISLKKEANLNLRDFAGNRKIEVYSPWINGTGTFVNPGSYYYDGNWERIDHFFSSVEVKMLDFYPLSDGPWCSKENSRPLSYKVYNSSGYSDHLPIQCIIE